MLSAILAGKQDVDFSGYSAKIGMQLEF